MSIEFRFPVVNAESVEDRDARWDEAITALQANGKTIRGTGPDGDWPLQLIPDEDGHTEVYSVVPLKEGFADD